MQGTYLNPTLCNQSTLHSGETFRTFQGTLLTQSQSKPVQLSAYIKPTWGGKLSEKWRFLSLFEIYAETLPPNLLVATLYESY